jgi:uncharacterized protein involved in exopolysaccharide biosynthesis
MAISTRARPESRGSATFTIRDYLNTCFYYRKIGIAVFLVVLGLGLTAAWFFPTPYKAQSTLLVLYAGYYDQSSNTQGALLAPAVGQLVSVEAQILNSPELQRKVVLSQPGAMPDPKTLDRDLQSFKSHFHLEQNDLANTIKLSYYDTNPQKAVDALDGLLKRYFEQRAAIFTSGRAGMLIDLRDEARAKLEKATLALTDFQKTHDVVNIEEQIARAIALESLLVQRKMENDAALAQDRSGLEALLEATQNVKENIQLFTDNSEMMRAQATMRLSLMELEAKRAELVSRYLPTSPFVQQIDAQIAEVREKITKQKIPEGVATRRGHNTYYDTVQDKIASLRSSIAGEEARQDELEEQVGTMRARLRSLIAVSNQLRQLQVDRDILAESFRERSRQAELAINQEEQAKEANSTNVRVIEAPELPTHRSIAFSTLVAASVVAAFVIAAMVGLLLSTLRETFLSPEQIERALSLRVLSAPIAQKRKRKKGSAPFASIDRRFVHHEYGQLASKVYTLAASKGKVVTAIAYGQDDDAQQVMTGLAVELSMRASKPVLILDLFSSEQEFAYGRPNSQGTIVWEGVDVEPNVPPSIVFAGGEDGVLELLEFYPVAQQNIIIARSKIRAERLSKQQVNSIFERLRNTYEYVLVDMPPMERSSFVVENISQTDAAVLVIRAESTRKPIAQILKTQTIEADGNIIGIAMTHRRVYIPGFVYRILTSRSRNLKAT